MLILTAALVLGGVYYMLTQFGDELDSELDSQVRTVRRDFDGDVRRLQRNIEQRARRAAPGRHAHPLTRKAAPKAACISSYRQAARNL